MVNQRLKHTFLRPSYSLQFFRTCSKNHGQNLPVRVRFAPSPTGHLHLGGLRTALYNFLFARSNRGSFILRIEDTDQKRCIQGAAERLENNLKWAGIAPDESPIKGGGFGPYIQSQRLHFYHDKTEFLLQNGMAYYCFCSSTRLDMLRREAMRMQLIPRYDNNCRKLTIDEARTRIGRGDPHCVRFKLEEGAETFQDLVLGRVTLDTAGNEGDPIILKQDAFPTYHLACVIDDHLMKISHVLRGVEWQISTTKHLQMHRAFGWDPPLYGHLPLLLNPDGTKLSKRQGDIDVDHYKQLGIFPEAMLSFTSEFGGGFKREKTGIKPRVYSLKELIQQFDPTLLSKNSCRVDIQRLTRLNRQCLEEKFQSPERLEQLISETRILLIDHFRDKVSSDSPQLSSENIQRILIWALPRVSSIKDLLSEELQFIWITPKPDVLLEIVSSHPEKYTAILDQIEPIMNLLLTTSKDLNAEHFAQLLRNHCKNFSIDNRAFMKVIRAALAGLKAGPPLGEIFYLIGPQETLHRLQQASRLGKLDKCVDNCYK